MKKTVCVLTLLLLTLLIGCSKTVENNYTADCHETTKQKVFDSGIGGIDSVYNDSFTMIPTQIIELIGETDYAKWCIENNTIETSVKAFPDDPYEKKNIYTLIREFEIEREALESVYYNTNLYYSYDYNFDLLYGNNENEVYSYYLKQNTDYRTNSDRIFLFDVKQLIKKYVGKERFREWIQTHNNDKEINNDTIWSIPEAIKYFDITRDEFEMNILSEINKPQDNAYIIEGVYEDGSTEVIYDSSVQLDYNLDLDLLYGDEIERSISKYKPIEVDNLLVEIKKE